MRSAGPENRVIGAAQTYGKRPKLSKMAEMAGARKGRKIRKLRRFRSVRGSIRCLSTYANIADFSVAMSTSRKPPSVQLAFVPCWWLLSEFGFGGDKVSYGVESRHRVYSGSVSPQEYGLHWASISCSGNAANLRRLRRTIFRFAAGNRTKER